MIDISKSRTAYLITGIRACHSGSNDTLRFTQSCYNGTDERYFTPGAALPLVYLDNPASARIALPWEMYNEFMWAILFLLLSLSAGIYILTTYLRAHRKLKHLPNS